MGTFTFLQVDNHHTYLIEQNGQVSRQSEIRLKMYIPSTSIAGKVPRTEEPYRQPIRHNGWRSGWTFEGMNRGTLRSSVETQMKGALLNRQKEITQPLQLRESHLQRWSLIRVSGNHMPSLRWASWASPVALHLVVEAWVKSRFSRACSQTWVGSVFNCSAVQQRRCIFAGLHPNSPSHQIGTLFYIIHFLNYFNSFFQPEPLYTSSIMIIRFWPEH